MDIHRRFNFDDPEDSYWNENNSEEKNSIDFPQIERPNLILQNGSSFFDDEENEFVLPSAVTPIGYQISNLLETSNETKKINDITKNFDQILDKPSTSSIETLTRQPEESISDGNSFSDKSSIIDIPKSDPNRKTPHGTASIVSDCSLGSYSSEMTVQLDYLQTIKRISQSQSVSLDLYRAKQEKIELLEASLESMDHDVIITIILFLKRSLSNPIFRDILLSRPLAAEHYVNYLKESMDFGELSDTLLYVYFFLYQLFSALGRCEEAAMVEFTLACRKRQNDQKVQALKKCLVSGFSVSAINNEAKYVQEYINLLEKH